MLSLIDAPAGALSVRTGTVACVEPDGRVFVEAEGLPAPLPALFLQTTRSEPPVLRVGDAVLLALAEGGGPAYVVGRIAPFTAPPEAAGTSSPDEVRLAGRRVSIDASERLELRCGEGTVTITGRGKVVVRGTEVVSRARGTNKVQGATVQLN